MKNNATISTKQDTRVEIDKRIVYHQAGHITAIYLGNKWKQLPDIYFQAIIKQQEQYGQVSHGKRIVSAEGGSLIPFPEAMPHDPLPQQEQYRCAFEADIINLLAGSLAEAKYVALCDGEVFNVNLIHLDALHSYGGSSDLDIITEYMERFISCKTERDQKRDELFMAAYSFVNKRVNWDTISALAEFIMAEPLGIINGNKVISLLESRLVA
ncbi:conserved hypothetical protein [Crenothrix polyspora]|uniref:Uncharacterized protein n=1 Tax=Crenothrix polyspora TaxID=360316 RepID=A0A1R4HEE8_9GAMM|nr:hypothetical protein [Crenothrix polyspora]SJM94586.1 conserved hypothetical protein [Crenothrix polyspora]